MKDLKKSNSGSECRSNNRGHISQPVVFEDGEKTGGRKTSQADELARTESGRVAIYVRVSSEQQEKDETIESQLSNIKTYARQNQIGICDQNVYIDEGYTGKVLRRPALDKLLDCAHEGAYDQVLILNPFRLARNYGHQILLMEEFGRASCEVTFIQRPIGQGPDEDLLLQMQGVIAQYEHAKIQERTRRGKLHRMRNGELISGQRVFGYDYISRKNEVPAHYLIIETEAAVVRNIFHWFIHDSLSLRKIALRLRDAGVPAVRGGRWHASQIGRMLGYSLYTGTGYANKLEAVEPTQKTHQATYRKKLKSSHRKRPQEQWFPFSAPAIVEEEIFELAHKRLEKNRQLAARNTKHEYLLRGLICCKSCGSSMMIDTRGGYYMCPLSRKGTALNRGREPCDNKQHLPIVQLDEQVWLEVRRLLKKPSLLKRYYPKLKDKIYPKALGGSVDKLNAKIEIIQKQIKRTNNLFIQGILDQTSHKEKYTELKTTLQLLELQRDRSASDLMDKEDVEELLRSFKTFASTIKNRLDTSDFTTRRNIVENMLKIVIVDKTVITIEYTAPCNKTKLRNNPERGCTTRLSLSEYT